MIKEDIEKFVKIDESSMKLEYENFAEVQSRPKPEKTNNTFNRNQPKNQEEGEKDEEGFEKRQISRGGGFSRGRGRGRGGN